MDKVKISQKRDELRLAFVSASSAFAQNLLDKRGLTWPSAGFADETSGDDSDEFAKALAPKT
jgi:hypothetical protein